MKTLRAVVAGLVIFLLASCGEDINSGSVINKSEVAEHDVWVDGTMYCAVHSKVGTTTMCTAWARTPGYYRTQCRGGCYYLELKSCNAEMECRTGTKRVNPDEYANFNVGDYYGKRENVS